MGRPREELESAVLQRHAVEVVDQVRELAAEVLNRNPRLLAELTDRLDEFVEAPRPTVRVVIS